jgi:hypothetical protein
MIAFRDSQGNLHILNLNAVVRAKVDFKEERIYFWTTGGHIYDFPFADFPINEFLALVRAASQALSSVIFPPKPDGGEWQ